MKEKGNKLLTVINVGQGDSIILSPNQGKISEIHFHQLSVNNRVHYMLHYTVFGNL